MVVIGLVVAALVLGAAAALLVGVWLQTGDRARARRVARQIDAVADQAMTDMARRAAVIRRRPSGRRSIPDVLR